MTPAEPALSQDMPGDPTVTEAYGALNLRRVDLDRQMATLAANDPARDEVWQELEAVLVQLRCLIGRLAQSPARQLSELRAKAEVLATLLRPDDPESGPRIPEPERSALVLSLTEDVIRMPNL